MACGAGVKFDDGMGLEYMSLDQIFMAFAAGVDFCFLLWRFSADQKSTD